MLKYQTIHESKMFKVSKVKNTTTNKSWYSLIYWGGFILSPKAYEMGDQIGKFKRLSNGVEWKFKDLKTATKKYNWLLLKWA